MDGYSNAMAANNGYANHDHQLLFGTHTLASGRFDWPGASASSFIPLHGAARTHSATGSVCAAFGDFRLNSLAAYAPGPVLSTRSAPPPPPPLAADVSPIPSHRITFFTNARRDDVEYQARIRGLSTSVVMTTLDILVDIALWEFELPPDHQPLRNHLLKLINGSIHQMMDMVGYKHISGTGRPTRAGVATWAINRELALGDCFKARLEEPPQELDCESMLEQPVPDLTEAVWMSSEPPMTTVHDAPTTQVPSLALDNSKRGLIQCPACFRESKDRVIVPLSCHSALELYSHLQVEHQSDLDLYLDLEELSTKYNIQLLTPAEVETEVEAQDTSNYHGWEPEMPEVPTNARQTTTPETRPAMRCPICVRRKTEEQHKTYQDAYSLYMHIHLTKSHEVETEHGLGMDELADRYGLPQHSSFMVSKRKYSDVDQEPCDSQLSNLSSGPFKRHKVTHAEAEQEAKQDPKAAEQDPKAAEQDLAEAEQDLAEAEQSPEPYLHELGPYLHEPEPYLHETEPYLHEPEPFFHEPEPFFHEPEPYVHESEPLDIPRPSFASSVEGPTLAAADFQAELPLQQEQEYQLVRECAPSPEEAPQSSARSSPGPSRVPLIDEIRCPYCVPREKGPVFTNLLYWRAHMQLKHHDKEDAYLTYIDLAAKYHLPVREAEHRAHRNKAHLHNRKKVKAVYCLACPVGDSQLCIEESKYENGLYGLKDLREHIAAVHPQHDDGKLDQSAFNEKYRDCNFYKKKLGTDDIQQDEEVSPSLQLSSQETTRPPSQAVFDDEDLFGPEP